jgi:hypothetical protein
VLEMECVGCRGRAKVRLHTWLDDGGLDNELEGVLVCNGGRLSA